MADDVTKPNDEGGEGGDGGDKGNLPDPAVAAAAKAAADLKGKRKDFLARQAIKAQQDAVTRGGGDQQQTAGDEIDLTGVEPATAAKIRAALEDRTKVRGVVSDALKFGMEGSRKAKAYELASELGVEKDEIPDLIASLSSARTPEELDLRARELILEFKADGSLAPVKATAKKDGETPEGERKFDTGRSTSANRTSALLEKIDQIDMADPDAIAKLDKLKGEVDAIQKKANERRTAAR